MTFLAKIECKSCKMPFQKLNNHCMDECNIDNSDGCDTSIQECRNTSFEDETGKTIEHTYCHCLIPIDELENEDICEYKVDCDTKNGIDCNDQGKCVDLPGIIGKSCLCNIYYAGKYCDEERTCENALNKFQTPCLNGGSCEESNVKGINYFCNCKDGYYGQYCENVHPCHPLKVKVILKSL